MAISNLKGDIINGAFSLLRISGITVDPTPEDLELALTRLENMAAEFSGRNICTGYLLEDEPDPNTPHNMQRMFWHSYETNLAVRLMPDYGKGVTPDVTLIRQASAGVSFLSSSTAQVKAVPYPDRMPKGSGSSRLFRWSKFFRAQEEAPVECATKTMYIGETNDFIEHFDAYLKTGEDISSFTIEADTGLTISTSSNDTPDIGYTIEADGNSDGTESPLLQVKIVVTTSDSRIKIRIINFRLLVSDVIDT